MNSSVMAKGWLRQSWRRLRSAEDAFKEADYPYVVRQCQECVELALKALLMDVGVDVPKWHDVGPVLRRNAEKLSFLDKRTIQRLASHSRELRSDRERSMYGDEELELPPEEIYEQYDAEVALQRARSLRGMSEGSREGEGYGGRRKVRRRRFPVHDRSCRSKGRWTTVLSYGRPN